MTLWKAAGSRRPTEEDKARLIEQRAQSFRFQDRGGSDWHTQRGPLIQGASQWAQTSFPVQTRR